MTSVTRNMLKRAVKKGVRSALRALKNPKLNKRPHRSSASRRKRNWPILDPDLLTVGELRELLKGLGRKVDGTKRDLINRLRTATEDDPDVPDVTSWLERTAKEVSDEMRRRDMRRGVGNSRRAELLNADDHRREHKRTKLPTLNSNDEWSYGTRTDGGYSSAGSVSGSFSPAPSSALSSPPPSLPSRVVRPSRPTKTGLDVAPGVPSHVENPATDGPSSRLRPRRVLRGRNQPYVFPTYTTNTTFHNSPTVSGPPPGTPTTGTKRKVEEGDEGENDGSGPTGQSPKRVKTEEEGEVEYIGQPSSCPEVDGERTTFERDIQKRRDGMALCCPVKETVVDCLLKYDQCLKSAQWLVNDDTEEEAKKREISLCYLDLDVYNVTILKHNNSAETFWRALGSPIFKREPSMTDASLPVAMTQAISSAIQNVVKDWRRARQERPPLIQV